MPRPALRSCQENSIGIICIEWVRSHAEILRLGRSLLYREAPNRRTILISTDSGADSSTGKINWDQFTTALTRPRWIDAIGHYDEVYVSHSNSIGVLHQGWYNNGRYMELVCKHVPVFYSPCSQGHTFRIIRVYRDEGILVRQPLMLMFTRVNKTSFGQVSSLVVPSPIICVS